MGSCDKRTSANTDPRACKQSTPSACSANNAASANADTPLEWFDKILSHCLEYARTAKEHGHPIVGIMCEFTPRELIMAAGAVPVCLCGGSAETIPAAERDLPVNLCPLIKSTYGYHALGSNPFLEMADLVVAEPEEWIDLIEDLASRFSGAADPSPNVQAGPATDSPAAQPE